MKTASFRSAFRTLLHRLLGESDSRMERLLSEWVNDKNYLIPCISISDVSSLMGYTSPEVNEYVKIRYGMDFRTFVTELRVREAEHLLLEVREPIYRISEMCGFSDKGNFSRQFKKITGYTPMEWRSINGFKQFHEDLKSAELKRLPSSVPQGVIGGKTEFHPCITE